jgi:heme-degrading monooxygenase HmoA
MIVRTWRGATRIADADAYVDFLRRTGHAAYRQTSGNLGGMTLRRILDDRAEFVVVSFWRDLDAVKRFAGETYERAVFYSEDEEFLIARDEHTDHYEVMELELPAVPGRLA